MEEEGGEVFAIQQTRPTDILAFLEGPLFREKGARNPVHEHPNHRGWHKR